MPAGEAWRIPNTAYFWNVCGERWINFGELPF
jgi:hypothetical protein